MDGSVDGRSPLAGSHLSPLFPSGEEQTGEQEGTLGEEETHDTRTAAAASSGRRTGMGVRSGEANRTESKRPRG